jgi:RNA polymerase sigma-70 factor (ECF subfamily)
MDESLRTDDSVMRAVALYANMLVRVCFTYMKNIHDAEEVAQDTFLKMMEKQTAAGLSFENEEHCKAWLLRVAINLCKNRLRSPWFRKIQPMGGNDISFTPEESSVLHAVQQLPAKYRSVIHLYYIEGYSITEIGSLLDKKESTIGSQLHRARSMLKSKLKEDFDE